MRRLWQRFFNFRPRLTRPNGAAVVRPVLRMEPDDRIEAVWNPARALSDSAVSEDGWSTDAENDPGPRLPPSGGVEGRPTGGQAGNARPEQPWYGADRWRNHWQEQPTEDDQPRAGGGRPDAYSMADYVAVTGPRETTQDYRPTDAAAQAENGWPDHSRKGAYDSEGYRLNDYGDEGIQGRGSEDDARYDDKVGQIADVQGPTAAVTPDNDGIPLKWDEDE
jgi:hypothetical protein